MVYSYKQNNNDELNLGVGDVIEVLEEVEEGWWRGRLNNNTGVFPSNFVVLLEATSPQSAFRQSQSKVGGVGAGAGRLGPVGGSREDMVATNNANNLKASAAVAGLLSTDKDAPVLPPKPVREFCKVLYPYEPANGDELELVEGDIITIISKELPDKGWWKGEMHGKVGVFPDNFVTILPSEGGLGRQFIGESNKGLTFLYSLSAAPAPLKSERPTSMSKSALPSVIALVANNSNNGTSSSNGVHNNHSSNNNNTNHHTDNKSIVTTRKDSFGSKDSLTDSGIVTGNVAAYRRSLESKAVVDHPSIVDKPPRKSFEGSARNSASSDKMSELRKSLEYLDEKKQTPPPVLTKKPSVPVKKSPIAGVTSNLLSGLKKVGGGGGSANKAETPPTKDNLDGGGLSRMQVADSAEKHVHGERISMQADFDQVERSTGVLKDMRANRAKLPKGRRPPTSATSSMDMPSSALNGRRSGSNNSLDESGERAAASSQSEDELLKPKPREWEKNRAPWMAELKASQAKKSSPSSFDSPLSKSPDSRRDIGGDELPHHHNNHQSFSGMMTTTESTQQQHHEKFDMSKSFSSSYVSSSSGLMSSSSSSHTPVTGGLGKKVDSMEPTRSHSVDVKGVDSTNSMSKSVIVGRTSEETSLTSTATITSSSSSSTGSHIASASNPQSVTAARPTSVNLRSHNISPIGRQASMTNSLKGDGLVGEVTVTTATANGIGGKAEGDAHRITELEQRVLKLEGTVTNLMRLLRDESDKVKTLKTELEKYAQCVTQV